MDNSAPRSHGSSVLSACIVAAALIASALVVAHRPSSLAGNTVPGSASTARPAETPPIAQASAQEQFRSQVLAAPSLHTLQKGGRAYTLADVKVTRVIYSAKDDAFSFLYDRVWEPALTASGDQDNSTTLGNDGYGHYYGTVNLDSLGGDTDQRADVTIK